MSSIRNIMQSVQSREIIKQASDVVVYLGGQDYVYNKYLGGSQGQIVPFNDYVTSFSASYDLDAMIPSATITLAVPIQDDYLFRAPGGNNVIETMEDIRVFQKGYYLSATGNSVYYQVFKGFVTSINYATDGKNTNIAINAQGTMGLLERMQIDLAPADVSNPGQFAVPEQTTNYNFNPYKMIQYAFTHQSLFEGFDLTQIQGQGSVASSAFYDSLKNDFVVKWMLILADMARDVHVFGSPDVVNIAQDLPQQVQKVPESQTPENRNTSAIADNIKGPLSESDDFSQNDAQIAEIRKWTPEYSIGVIQLLNGNITSKLERLRYASSLIGYEAYQDVDGAIIFKPPLYNLDVMDTTAWNSKTPDTTVDSITGQRNPFVINLSEILNESESEDESAIRLTRITVKGNLNTSGMQVGGNALETLVGTVQDIDLSKIMQFGLRTEPPHHANFIKMNDPKSLYAFASSEMTRANLGFRSYTVTIPARPELKLGFPAYFPHKDIYGYIHSISNSFNKGGAATMTVTLNALRRRPLYPEVQNVNGVQQTLMTPQPNLVMQWTTPAGSNAASATPTTTGSSSPNLPGTPASDPIDPKTLKPQEKQLDNYYRNRMGAFFSPEADTVSQAWRVQLDKDAKFSAGPRTVESTYYNDLRTVRPYTDDKGYEVLGVFPWGRWQGLKQALYTFTVYDAQAISGDISSAQKINPSSVALTSAQAFLFTGEDTPPPATGISETMLTALSNQSLLVTGAKVFEIPATASTTPASSPTNASTATASPTVSTPATAATVFVTGQAPATNQGLDLLSLTSSTPSGASE
jgi:hypothetical protein